MLKITFIIAFLLFTGSFLLSIASWRSGKNKYFTAARYLFIFAVLSYIGLGLYRFYSHFGGDFINIASSIWGYFYIFSFLIIIIFYLYLKGWRSQLNSFTAIISPFISIILLISLPFLDSTRKIWFNPYPSGLFSYILPVHIIMSVIAEIFFFFSFAGSVLYLIMEWQLRKKRSLKLIYKLQNLESINNFIQWSIARSFLFISFGIITGIIMAYIAFNTVSMGTAKEFHIYFSWLVISCIFCIRNNKMIESHKASIINILLFILVMFLFIFTNIYITTGFHSFI